MSGRNVSRWQDCYKCESCFLTPEMTNYCLGPFNGIEDNLQKIKITEEIKKETKTPIVFQSFGYTPEITAIDKNDCAYADPLFCHHSRFLEVRPEKKKLVGCTMLMHPHLCAFFCEKWRNDKSQQVDTEIPDNNAFP